MRLYTLLGVVNYGKWNVLNQVAEYQWLVNSLPAENRDLMTEVIDSDTNVNA